MNIKKIISVSGQPGLYKIVSQAKFGLVAESLNDGRRMPVYASQRVSTLEDISIYTSDEDMPLKEVFKKIMEKENGGKAPDAKTDPEKMKTYFGEVLPDYDRERVYISDIKKVLGWYNILHEKDLLNQPEEESEDEKAETTDQKEVKAEGADKDSGEKKEPARKTAAKKKTATTAKDSNKKKATTKTKGTPRTSAKKTPTTTTRKTGGK